MQPEATRARDATVEETQARSVRAGVALIAAFAGRVNKRARLEAARAVDAERDVAAVDVAANAAAADAASRIRCSDARSQPGSA